MSAYALLLKTLTPSVAEVKEAIEGNLCRCTSYRTIIESIQAAAAELQAGGKQAQHELTESVSTRSTEKRDAC